MFMQDTVTQSIHPMATNDRPQHWMLRMEQLNEVSSLLANVVHSRLPNYLTPRCKPSLHDHWIWESFVMFGSKRPAVELR
jgi:hypothetical protein